MSFGMGSSSIWGLRACSYYFKCCVRVLIELNRSPITISSSLTGLCSGSAKRLSVCGFGCCSSLSLLMGISSMTSASPGGISVNASCCGRSKASLMSPLKSSSESLSTITDYRFARKASISLSIEVMKLLEVSWHARNSLSILIGVKGLRGLDLDCSGAVWLCSSELFLSKVLSSLAVLR